jgi:Tfp pilus assembly protein PilO
MMEGRKIFGSFVIAIALFFFWPTVVGIWQEVSVLRAAVVEREGLLKQRQDILANINSAYTDYQTKLNQQDGQKFTELVPVRKNTAELISAIQDIADNSGITVNEIHINEGKDITGQFKTFTISLDMGGSYSALRSFLKGLEQYVRLLNVNNLKIASDTQTPGRLRFTLQADTYFLK